MSLWIVQQFLRFCVVYEGLGTGQALSAVLALARAVSYRGAPREVCCGARGDFPRWCTVGERHLPSPSSNSFFDWLLTLTSLPGAACSVQWKSPLQADRGCVPRQICWEWDFLGASSQCGSDVWVKNIQMVIISYIHLIYSFFNHSTFWL